MGFANVVMAMQPNVCNVDGTDYFMWNIDAQGTLHVTPIESTTTNFEKSPFYKFRKQIKNVIIEDDFYCERSFSTIGRNFFKGLDHLESVQLSKSVRNIGESCFEGCTALRDIDIPATVEYIGRNALKGCPGLVNVHLPFIGADGSIWVNDTDKNELSWVFGNSKGREYYTVGQKYGDKAITFSLPASLRSISVNSGIICYDVFANCVSLDEISLGKATVSLPTSLATGNYHNMPLYTRL